MALLWSWVILGVGGAGSSAHPDPDQEADRRAIKVLVTMHLVQFTRWPEGTFRDRTSPYRIGFVGESEESEAMEVLIGQQQNTNRPIQAVRIDPFKEGPETEEHNAGVRDQLRRCHVVLIAATEKRRVESILEAVQDSRTLTISDLKRFARSGGMIELTLVKERYKFIINHGKLVDAGLKIDASVLDLAKEVLNHKGRPSESTGS